MGERSVKTGARRIGPLGFASLVAISTICVGGVAYFLGGWGPGIYGGCLGLLGGLLGAWATRSWLMSEEDTKRE